MLSLIEVEVIHGQIIAKANGYKSVNDMAARAIGQAKFNEMFGGIPGMDKGKPRTVNLLCRYKSDIIQLNVLFINSLNNPKETQRDKYRKTCEDARYPLLDVRGCRLCRCPFSFSFICISLLLLRQSEYQIRTILRRG